MVSLLHCFTILIIYRVYKVESYSENPSVIIVGAGSAGMSAATTLIENSILNVKIIEAENRIGGRIKSVLLEDTYVDEGAQFCDGEKGNIVHEMVKDLDLLDHSRELTENLYYSNGSQIKNEIAEDLKQYLLNYQNIINIKNITGRSIGEAFMQSYHQLIEKYSSDKENLKIVKEGIMFAENYVLLQDGAFSWNKPSAERHYQPCEGDSKMSWRKRGYKMVFDVLTKNYPNPSNKLPIDDKIILNKKVSKILWNDSGVIVETSDKSTFSADHVIVTIPLGVLKEEQNTLFDPLLPEYKQQTIEAIGFGTTMKIYLHFPKKWWSDNDTFFFLWSDEDRLNAVKEFPHGPSSNGVSWVSSVVSLLQIGADSNILDAWVTGNMIPEIEKTSEEIILEGCMYVIRKFLGKQYEIAAADRIIRTQWFSNPNFRGTYSYEQKEYFQKNVSYHDKLGKPLGGRENRPVVLFAGEATNHRQHYSSVHGAIETGRREAERIINLYT